MLVTELPDDILYSIFPYLNASEFLRFTSSSRALLPLRETVTFWHALTLKTFRIPPQPLLQGARWQWLYKKLLTQTKLYTWGSNGTGNLGRDTTFIDAEGEQRGRWSSGWPRQPRLDGIDVGIIADVQCGGWCTTLLNSVGNVFIFGVLDGMNLRNPSDLMPRQLLFPPAYPLTTKTRYEPSTAIKQLSTGRSTALGLSDDGKVWSWTTGTAAMIKPLHVDLSGHKAMKVGAGWDRGSMYVQDVGIVYWASVRDSDFLVGGRQENLAVADALLIDTVTIPGTGFRRTASGRYPQESLESRIGEVTNHIVLESHIVFTTHLNKVFSYPNTYPMPAIDMSEPIELTTFTDSVPKNHPFRILDLQGAFRNFAVFSAADEILIANRDLLDTFHNIQASQITPSPPLPIPSLLQQPSQHSRTISLAFGDHHIHALHENGTLTSWGLQSQGCGALGLGDSGREVIRGIMAGPWRDQNLAQDSAKTVWFEPLMERWLADVYRKATQMGLLERAYQTLIPEVFGEYYEKEGAKWEIDVPSNEGELGAYFVLKVAAAGWSSAALVLVDEERAETARNSHIIRPTAATSESDSAAEYEYGDSPFDMVEIALSSMFGWIQETIRWFLRLAERNARKGPVTAGRHNVEDGGEGGEYTWSENPVPLEIQIP